MHFGIETSNLHKKKKKTSHLDQPSHIFTQKKKKKIHVHINPFEIRCQTLSTSPQSFINKYIY